MGARFLDEHKSDEMCRTYCILILTHRHVRSFIKLIVFIIRIRAQIFMIKNYSSAFNFE